MSKMEYEHDLIAAVADAIATADNDPYGSYEELAVAALEGYRLYRLRLAEEFTRLSQTLDLRQEDDGA
jgi:hypothetical protein